MYSCDKEANCFSSSRQCHMILQKSFQYADFGAQETLIIMIYLKMVVLLTIFMETVIFFSVFFDEHSIFYWK